MAPPLRACLATRSRCGCYDFEMWLGLIDNPPRQIGFRTIALVVHSNAICDPLGESQVVEALAAFLIISLTHFLHVSFREFHSTPVAVGEKKHDTIRNATTIVDIQCHCRRVLSPMRRDPAARIVWVKGFDIDRRECFRIANLLELDFTSEIIAVAKLDCEFLIGRDRAVYVRRSTGGCNQRDRNSNDCKPDSLDCRFHSHTRKLR